jgi:hypothetical protein
MVEGMVTVAALSESAKIFLSRCARRTAPASLAGGDLGPFQRAAGLGEVQIARYPAICVRATRPPRGSGFHDQSHRRHHLPALTRRHDPYEQGLTVSGPARYIHRLLVKVYRRATDQDYFRRRITVPDGYSHLDYLIQVKPDFGLWLVVSFKIIVECSFLDPDSTVARGPL